MLSNRLQISYEPSMFKAAYGPMSRMSMRIFANWAKLLETLLMACLLVACADRDGGATDAPVARDPSLSLGIAAQGISGSAWKIVQAVDVNYDGMADVIWNDPGRNQIARLADERG